MKRLRRIFTHWQNRLGLILVFSFISIGFVAPLISPEDAKNPGAFRRAPGYTFADLRPHPPSEKAILGTLPSQYDVFHALIWGIPNALEFGLKVALTSAVFGVLFGATAAYAVGFINNTMLRIADSFLSFPVIAGVVFLDQLWLSVMIDSGGVFVPARNEWYQLPSGPLAPIQWLFQHINPLTFTLILFSWMPYARLTNIMVINLKQLDFIQATRALGASPARVILRHLIPNAISPAMVLAARDVGSMVILQATFTFIGISGGSVWGEMLALGRNWIVGIGGGILTYWWTFIPATLALILFGMGWNLFGDAMNELLDPHST
jgi:peptide/nickel transport system permease protein